MVISTCLRRLKTVKRLGLANCLRVVQQRYNTYRFNRTWQQSDPIRSWETIATELGCTPSFERFFSQQRTRSLQAIESLLVDLSDDACVRMADEFVRNEFCVLGSQKCGFEQIPWHKDIRLNKDSLSADLLFDATNWYTQIAIETTHGQQLGKDIKVAWELSRLQHLVILGRAYMATHDQRYVATFKEHVSSWLANNPFLHGINWVCPMEVALRAISLVIAFTSFSRSSLLDDDFWLSYVTSLYNHFSYLEHNWELYDLRTSNHYVADLVGYIYLCWFFNDCPNVAKRTYWCHEQVLAELGKQINPDGSSYEHSTSYHRLVTELFYHHRGISQQLRLPIPAQAEHQLAAMDNYLNWCTPVGGSLITIGDNDSGKVTVVGLPIDRSRGGAQQHTDSGIGHFPHAGLSLIKTAAWHVSLRHAVYHEQEPTSHMHNDVTSITLAYNGIPFIVDPGTYVYTASAYWRNLFRSVQAHSGMYLATADIIDNIQPVEPVPLDETIFLLRRKPAIMPEQETLRDSVHFSMRTTHNDYLSYGYRPERVITLDEQSSTLLIDDQWHSHYTQGLDKVMSAAPDQQTSSPWYACTQFVLHPDVTITHQEKSADSCWHLEFRGIKLELCSAHLTYELQPAWYSPDYGVKVATHKLFAKQDLAKSIEQVRTTMKHI